MSLQNKLLNWFQKNQRPLPWRQRYRPYEVWVSEIMLQQTQVETVLPYFKRWMKTFPNIKTLAQSDERKVLKLWEGLGYYSRARNLHKSAQVIVEKFGSEFPQKFEDIQSLKGVGRYTAGAIASIAFNQEKPIVDGNVLRVLSRLYAISKNIDQPKNRELFWELEKKLIPKGEARFFNQALMELGALICTKDNPSCDICPVSSFCKAYKQNKVENFPVRSKRRETVKVEAAALILSRNGKFLIRKRPLGQIMGGLWEFPEWKLTAGLTEEKTRGLAEKDFRIKLNSLKHLASIKRNYTHHLETLHVFWATTSVAPTRNGWPSAWAAKKDFKSYPFSSAHAKIANILI